ncbi:CPBP family intramembrane glutamic endopeptidase [Vulcanisaeta souniana]|nr:CPBP family intramembrane glutamic endopeptidase [Vulcanisaeta souniana]
MSRIIKPMVLLHNLMGNYIGNIIWPTILFIAIFIPVFITYEPYIMTNAHYDISSSIIQTLNSTLGSPVSLASTYLLGDLAPYLYLLIVALLIAYRKEVHRIVNELGLSWRPLFGKLTIPIVLVLAVLWFLVSGLIPLTAILPQVSLTNVLLLIYTLYPIAISEELVFRGFILNKLLPRRNSTKPISIMHSIPAILISAIYFTAAHLPIYLAMYGVNDLLTVAYILSYIFIYGLISGFIFALTSNVIPDIIMHWINDYLSIMVIIYSIH